MDYPNILESITQTISDSREGEMKAKAGYDALTSVCLYADGLQAGCGKLEEMEFYYRMYFEVDKFRDECDYQMKAYHRRASASEKLLTFLPDIKKAVEMARDCQEGNGLIPRIDTVWEVENFWFEEDSVKFKFEFVPDPNDTKNLLLSVNYDRDEIERTFYTDGVTSFTIWDVDTSKWIPPHEDDFIVLGERFEDFFAELKKSGEVEG